MLEQPRDQADETGEHAPIHVRTFLIADIRGYTSFTKERGDEAAAELASIFAQLTREGIASFGGQVVELRGDEALATFPSTRQALRAAVDLQLRYAHQSQEQPGLPMPAGIGVDAGEAVAVEGGFRGAALNMAARLCSAAGPGEILTTETVTNLAGTIDGLRYEPRRLKLVKGISERVHAVRVTSEELERLAPSLPQPAQAGEPQWEPSVQALSERDWQNEAGGLGEQISSMVQARLAQVNENLERELSDIPGSVLHQRPPVPGSDPPPTPVLPASTQGRSSRRWVSLLLVVVIILVIVIALWVLLH